MEEDQWRRLRNICKDHRNFNRACPHSVKASKILHPDGRLRSRSRNDGQ